MSYTIIRPKDRNEWLEHRKSGIGSSEVAQLRSFGMTIRDVK